MCVKHLTDYRQARREGATTTTDLHEPYKDGAVLPIKKHEIGWQMQCVLGGRAALCFAVKQTGNKTVSKMII